MEGVEAMSHPVTETALLATTTRQIETDADSWPFPSFFADDKFAGLDAGVLWRRIEAYTSWRSTKRGVIWTVEGPGSWEPPLFPAKILSTKIWTPAVDGWSVVEDIPPGPMGRLWLSGAGPFQIIGEVGDNDAVVPPPVMEAFRRLAEYWVGEASSFAGSSHTVESVGLIRSEVYRDPAWMASAMQNSGAADLLRSFRKVP